MGYRIFATTTLAALLAACGGDDASIAGGGSGGPPTTTLTGTAAVGAPISGATISAKCKSGTAPAPVTTGANGGYGLVVPTTAFPCVIRSSGGTVVGGSTTAPTLHSFATTTGTANVTPLTDLALALQVNNTAG